VKSNLPDAQGTGASAGEQLPDQRLSGSISGIIVDQTGAPDAGARVRLHGKVNPQTKRCYPATMGGFPCQRRSGPSAHDYVGGLRDASILWNPAVGETYTVPQIALLLLPLSSEVRVIPHRPKFAEDQIRVQRAAGTRRRSQFYVRYVQNASPLSSKQKFELAGRPPWIQSPSGVTGSLREFSRRQNDFSGYGQGAQGYAKPLRRLLRDVCGHAYRSAILHRSWKTRSTLLLQGEAAVSDRGFCNAIANSVILQRATTTLAGKLLGYASESFAAGGISNLLLSSQRSGRS